MGKHLSTELKRFNYLTSEIEAAYHEAALKLGLSDSAMLVLYTICNNGEACLVYDITRLSGVSKQTVHSALRKLENENVVYLENADGRKKKVCLTGKGKALVKHTVLRLMAMENEIFDAWSEAERNIYLELTQRYLSAFQEKMKEL